MDNLGNIDARGSCDMVLATDLDGTFLGGTRSDRKRLYEWLNAVAASVRLIFVTGRDPEFISDLCADGFVPAPEYVIGDVGTTIARFEDGQVRPMNALEADIAAAWGNRSEQVRALLGNVPGLREQNKPFRYRLSYEYDARFHADDLQQVRAMGLDVLISHGCFVDVLPPGISKGPSLLKLLDHLELPHERVLVAGDTLNDLSMFQTGLHGAVMGGAERDLLSATAALPRAYHCTHPGAAGIIEAIHAHSFHPTPPKHPNLSESLP